MKMSAADAADCQWCLQEQQLLLCRGFKRVFCFLLKDTFISTLPGEDSGCRRTTQRWHAIAVPTAFPLAAVCHLHPPPSTSTFTADNNQTIPEHLRRVPPQRVFLQKTLRRWRKCSDVQGAPPQSRRGSCISAQLGRLPPGPHEGLCPTPAAARSSPVADAASCPVKPERRSRAQSHLWSV